MDYSVSNNTLDCLKQVVYDINMELLKEVHEKYLSDIDFSELKVILDGIQKKKFNINSN
jgi:hypothetical protein